MDTDDQASMIPPRYQRLSDELAEAIHGGRLPVGSRLPSLRQMALQRRLSLNTVIAAYRQLEDAGLVIPRPKAGFEVAPRLSVPERSLRDTPSAPTAPLQQVLMARVLEAQRRPGVVDLAFAGPRGRQFYPGAQLARHTAQVLRHGQQTVETYARPNGSPRLLAQIVRRSPRMGLHTHAERLLLTHGAMEALQLALRAVTQPGDAVGIEAPSYFNLYPLLANLGLQAIELPTHPQHGLDVDALDALLEHRPLAALVVMPTVHNPLGCTMPTAAKQHLAELVNARQLPLIEDAVYAELQFCEPPAPLLKAFDRDGWVMVVGGFSKTLAPDYRIGWLDGGRFAERIALLKFQSTGGEPQLLGDAVAAYLEAGSYEHHLHRMRRLYREQVGRLRQLVAEHFPAGTRATEPQGGFLLWLELPGVDTRELFERALLEDIVFMPGQVYSRGARYRHCLRLSCCQSLDARFIGAVERLGAIARELAVRQLL
ncbi:PLP-dependent aminotransferase family protein [Stenotrophomonas hibiscicola]|uniref:aminotransferase-like domain-containing protein n=1 Tax=Stenotrophomonas hibiscicola TaxID=86189 RepID=UPI0003708B7D|nr:PLP-dependent aminotransferase family protein [[Pseudomonas] hibiscicola]MBH1444297.1 PLP-dependent aminotransferase family protein [Stenotrophomonas maltophilia]MBO0396435.1 PLP-dependent aminotransferase family protein [Stenotrophomonas maltophilia]UXB24653.1 PLP-dependent aminotransferase family protein [Stenotrophomonas maltophilia]UXB40683.1 PLP-dependent aminotransferase family protein [Stenotrophomonas maltophilia]